jgi:signal transduction histidine kinase
MNWYKILQVRSIDPDDARRRNILNILLAGVFASAVVGILVTAYGVINKRWAFADEIVVLSILLLFFFGVLIIYYINRRWGKPAIYLFVSLLVVAYAFSDTPQQISEGRSVFFFAIPIIIASLLIHPLASFIVAIIGSGIITWAANSIDKAPNSLVLIGFFMLALVSWVTTRSLENALKELRTVNANLDLLVQERTQALADALARERIDAGRNEAILESIADGVIVFDVQGRAIIANPASEQLLELPKSEIYGADIVKLSHAKMLDTRNGAILANALSNPSRQLASNHLQWGKKNLSITSAQVFDENIPIGTVAVFRDYTREAEVERMKDTFLAVVSHELRTPLNAILGYAEMLKEAVYGTINEKQARASDRIISSSQRLLGIVNDLLDQSQIQAGKISLHTQAFQPAELVENIHALMDNLASEKGLSLTSYLDTNLPKFLLGDMPRLQQITVNLVNNAIKFTENGSVVFRVLRIDQGHWSLEVKDSGIGIPEDDLPHIFDPFYQVDSTATRKHGGFGLGLSIVKQMANLMGGDATVISKVGLGSTFTVTLPLILKEGK